MHSMKLIRRDPVYISTSESSGLEVSRPEIPYLWQLIAWVSLMVVIFEQYYGPTTVQRTNDMKNVLFIDSLGRVVWPRLHPEGFQKIGSNARSRGTVVLRR